MAQEGGGVFAELAVVGTKGGAEMAVDVEFADDDGFAGGSGGATDALVERDAGVRGHGAAEGTEDEHVAVVILFEQVEADPVVASEFGVEKGDDILHEGVGG